MMYDEPFSYGHPISPQPTDPNFPTEAEAISAAKKHQDDAPFDSILAVWNNDSGEVLCLIFEGCEYRP